MSGKLWEFDLTSYIINGFALLKDRHIPFFFLCKQIFQESAKKMNYWLIHPTPVGSKKGSNPIQSIKLVKVNGAVLSISTSEDSKYFAVGSDQGYVSFCFYFSSSYTSFILFL